MKIHEIAFNYYYSLEKPELKAVADKMGVSFSTVCRWARQYQWRELYNQRKIQEGDKALITEVKAGYRALIGKLVDKAEEAIKEGKLQIESVEDLAILAELDMHLQPKSNN